MVSIKCFPVITASIGKADKSMATNWRSVASYERWGDVPIALIRGPR